MDFTPLLLNEMLTINKLISFHYFEYAKGYAFEGEQHDFWEFLYVDKGSVEIRSDERTLELSQGTIIFHKPGEFHTVRVGEQHKPPNLIVISFECNSHYMSRLDHQVISLGSRERNLLSLILQEGFHSFSPPFDDPHRHNLTRKPEAPFGSEQVLKIYLEALLIQLIRIGEEGTSTEGSRKPSAMQSEKAEQKVVQNIEAYMKEQLSEQLTLDQLCKAVHLGKSRLKEIFQSQKGTGAIEYFKLLKIQEAKTLIREKHYNYTEIATMLGYASIHYFSRDFKKSTGMSPSEYARTLKARADSTGNLD
ncbi:AraC family transcriptional regulator [Cohnella sp. WQ 127256]|uniref:helix-turn-helix domain-containing protein n=1 Tax=Cohnella sp. WQ 127256 TaxID=2938790 RepID=UPI002118C0DB|nr:AraC family transcriptional regulator [Cohnella sp. WQ 127256]